MEVINPQLKEVERKIEDLRETVFHMRGEIDANKHSTRDLARQTIWQFIVFVVTMGLITIAGIRYQADVMRNEMNIRFEAMEKRMEQTQKDYNARLEQTEKNITARFEDLKQEVRANRK